MTAWAIQQLRITAFTTDGQVDRTESWWQTIVEAPYENKSVRPGGVAQSIEGPWEGGRLVLSVQIPRVDLVAAAVVDPMSELSDVPVMGEFDKLLSRIVPMGYKCLSMVGSITRLAVGGVLVGKVSDRVEGYKALQPYLPKVEIDPEGSSDFQYRINRSRPSKVIENLRVNRLQTWSVLAVRQFSVPLVGLSQTAEAKAHLSPSYSALRLEVDVNSAPRDGVISPDKVVPLFDELILSLKEVSEKGDIA